MKLSFSKIFAIFTVVGVVVTSCTPWGFLLYDTMARWEIKNITGYNLTLVKKWGRYPNARTYKIAPGDSVVVAGHSDRDPSTPRFDMLWSFKGENGWEECAVAERVVTIMDDTGKILVEWKWKDDCLPDFYVEDSWRIYNDRLYGKVWQFMILEEQLN